MRLQLDPLTVAALAPAPRRRRATAPPPLAPEQERSLLETGLGAVEYIGRTLDKPGAAARGTINGLIDLAQGQSNPDWGGGLMNLIPFSDTAGITDPHERVSGRDILENVGVAPPNKPGLFNDPGDFMADVGGFATEVVTDPLLYMTGPLGTLTKTGKAAKAAARGAKRFEQSGDFLDAAAQFTQAAGRGKKGLRPLENPATLIDQIKAGERSSLGFRMPFTEDAAFTLADLPGGSAVDHMVAGGLEKMHYGTGPLSGAVSAPMRGLRALADVSAQGQFAPEAQRMADMAWTEARRITGAWEDFAPTAAAREQELLSEFTKLAEHVQGLGATPEQAYREFARYAAEMPNVQNVTDVQQIMAESLGRQVNVTQEMAQPFYDYFDQMGKAKDLLYKELDQLGGHAPDLMKREYMSKHVHRRATNKRSKIVEPRDDLFVNVPGGSRTLIRMSRDNTLTGYAEDLPRLANGRPDTQFTVRELRQKLQQNGIAYQPGDDLATLQEKWIAEHFLEPELLKAHGAGTIDNATYQKMLDEIHNPYQVTENGAAKTLKPKKEQFRKYWKAQPAAMRDEGIFARQLLEDQQSYMKDLIGRIATMREVHAFMKQPGVLSVTDKVPLVDAWQNAGYSMHGLQKFGTDNIDLLNQMGSSIGNLTVSERVARSLKSYHKLMAGKADSEFIRGIDQVMAAYKWGLTGVFPSFHVRNRLSGVWQAWSEGNASLKEIVDGGQAVAKHMQWQHTGKGEQLSDEFITFLKTNDLLGANQTLEYGAKRSAGLEEIRPIRTLLDPLKPSSWKGKASEKFNPLNVKGVSQKVDAEEVAENVLSEMSGHAFQYVEALNRAGYAKALWDKGYRPSEIANMVRRTQFDYSELTSVEQNIIKRLVPFWTFTKKNVPYQVKKLMERPGGRTAQTFRAMSQYDPEEEYTPGFIREKLSIRSPFKGDLEPGEQTFMTQTGLPIEDFNKVVFGPGGGRRSAQKLASNLHPLLVAGLRQFTGEDPYTGRELKHLQSITENVGLNIPNESVRNYVDRTIQASPLSRLFSEASGVTDVVSGRKSPGEGALDLLTGANFGTYDVEMAKARDLAAAQQKLADTYPQVFTAENYFVPKSFTGPQADQARQAVTLLRQLEKARKQLREKKEYEKSAREVKQK